MGEAKSSQGTIAPRRERPFTSSVAVKRGRAERARGEAMHFKSLSVASVLVALGVAGVHAETVVPLPDINVTTDTPIAPRRAPVAAPSPTAAPAPIAAPASVNAAPTFAEPAESAPAGLVVDNVINSRPYSDNHVPAAEISRTASPNVAESLDRYVPSVSLQSPTGNMLQPDVEYRGFVASPVEGTPQGLAVYQNGVRVNEAFGDTVNWDLIPTFAIASMDLVSNNPAYGLNALGGALNIRMKDGFSFQGGRLEVQGGSYGRIQAGLEYGQQIGQFAFYGALEYVHDNGYRNFSESTVRRFYGDLGYRNDGNEFHLNVGLASNSFGAAGTSPIQMLEQNWAGVYTTPQTSERQYGMVNLTSLFTLTPTWTLNANAYVRRLIQRTVDGNPTNVYDCGGATLCFNEDNPSSTNIASASFSGQTLGEIDRTRTLSTSTGTAFQLSNTDALFGHKNRFSVGASFDYGMTTFGASSELGTIGSDYVVTGSGVQIGTITDPTTGQTVFGPVDVHTINRYLGLYALDAFDVSDQLTLSAGGRLNYATISLFDQIPGGDVNGQYAFTHFNPLAGFTYKFLPGLQAYGSYAESNRAPTPLELACADPERPCMLATFLVSDPALKQVVSRTLEAGLRGQHDFGPQGALSWKAGAFRTRNENDILSVASEQTGYGYYTNVGATLRQGVEASVNYRIREVTLRASYTYLDATFQSDFELTSNSPTATANGGEEQVYKGAQIPMIPRHRVKFSADWDLTSRATIGADLLFVSAQRYVGDEENKNAKLPAYFTIGLNASYRVMDNVTLFARAINLLDRRYYTYGTYLNLAEQPFSGTYTDARSVSPAQPLSVYGGIRVAFDAPKPALAGVAEKY